MASPQPEVSRDHPALAWAASGGMWLTGTAGGPPLVPAGPVLARAQQLLDGFNEAVAGWGSPVRAPVSALLFGRAAWMGLARRGRRSANGTCRLLPAADGWAAVNLARPEDVESVAAIIGDDHPGDPWSLLATWAAETPAAEVAARAQLLAVPAAPLPVVPVPPAEPVQVPPVAVAPARTEPPVVVDLSSLWAGPLCAHLLGRAGARVIKVESTTRPDGGRAGHPAFWAWLHAGHEGRVVDLGCDEGRAELFGLIRSADIVIDSSRPRALAQLGIVAEDLVAEGRGLVWVSITGYGRSGPWSDRVAFGDDAAVAGGLVAWDASGAPVFCGDAIADPLSGLAAAAGAAAAWPPSGGQVIDVAMAPVAAWAGASTGAGAEGYDVHRSGDGGWAVEAAGQTQAVLPPRPPAGR